jgi:hypothetical protein
MNNNNAKIRRFPSRRSQVAAKKMVSVPARRQQLAYGRELGLSARRACALFSVARSTLKGITAARRRRMPRPFTERQIGLVTIFCGPGGHCNRERAPVRGDLLLLCAPWARGITWVRLERGAYRRDRRASGHPLAPGRSWFRRSGDSPCRDDG